MIATPLKILSGSLEPAASLTSAIDQSITQLINTPVGACPCDRDYGFGLSALRFEIINEKEGVVYNSAASKDAGKASPLGEYSKKISGNSKNLNTFAADLKAAIGKYESRLTDVNVSMAYRREERKLHIVIKGLIEATNAKYEYQTSIKVWN